MDVAQIIVGLGIGGFVGAAAASWKAVQRSEAALARFHQALSKVLAGQDSPAVQEVKDAYQTLQSELALLAKGLSSLGKSLKWK